MAKKKKECTGKCDCDKCVLERGRQFLKKIGERIISSSDDTEQAPIGVNEAAYFLTYSITHPTLRLMILSPADQSIFAGLLSFYKYGILCERDEHRPKEEKPQKGKSPKKTWRIREISGGTWELTEGDEYRCCLEFPGGEWTPQKIVDLLNGE